VLAVASALVVDQLRLVEEQHDARTPLGERQLDGG
jgi:hypothetical protein